MSSSGDSFSNGSSASSDLEGDRPIKKRGIGQAIQSVLAQKAVPVDGAPVLAKSRKRAKEIEAEKKEKDATRELRRKRKLLADKDHVKPITVTNSNERRLLKIATRGVVQLFNAISQERQRLDQVDHASSKATDIKKVSQQTKSDFLEMVKKYGSSKAMPTPDGKADKSNKDAPDWTKDDYMLGAKMKDWDKDDSDASDSSSSGSGSASGSGTGSSS
eukprot:TRINITY_DN8559_c0_g1_i2.p1 TRINITY_DN8559_c0_g1~~TRINITY_DN8559_c0_g1_i2.p1  ORF type:complete len:217 (-),score=70.58 TRINITY_DN8559_c0_g1_i2:11-661(-)